MKKIFLLSVLMTAFSYSQVTDENGNNAVNSGNTSLSGNIGIGVTPSSTSPYKLEISGTVKAAIGVFNNSQPDGAVYINWADRNRKCMALAAGKKFDATQSLFTIFDFPQSNLNTLPQSAIGLEDRNYKTRWGFNADAGGASTLTYYNKNQNEFFKLSEDGNDNVYLQLGKPNSRLRIGGYADYLPEHKFVVKEGSAMIEGNILTNANIGIGTSSFVDGTDTYRLSIEGKVRAHEIKVYTTWADFVFEPNYNLPTLKEVENYISENGHLKDIPSAEEVKRNGIELGKMNKLLLQKIEELTIYIIELKKEVEILKSKIEGKK